MYRPITLWLVALAFILAWPGVALSQDDGASETDDVDEVTEEVTPDGDGAAPTEEPGADVAGDESDDDRYARLTGEATEFYNSKEYDAAILKLEEAYTISENPAVLYNMARIAEEAGNLPKAVEWYEAFVKAPNVPIEGRKDAMERLKILSEISDLTDGHVPPGDPVVLDPTPTPVDPPPVEPKSNTLTVLGVVFTTVGGIALGSGAVFAFLASQAYDDFDTATTLDERRAAADDVDVYAPTADGLMIGGGVIAATGIVMLIVDAVQDDSDPSSASIEPILTTNGAAVGVRWTF